MSRFFRNALIGLSILSVCGLAQAQAPRIGIQAGVSVPLQDLKKWYTDKPGLSGTFYLDFDLGDGFLLRPRLDGTIWPDYKKTTQITVNNQLHNVDHKFVNYDISAGMDYLIYFNDRPQGVYVALGGALHQLFTRYEYVGPDKSFNETNRKTFFGVSAGLGYNFSEFWDVHMRYNYFTGSKVNVDQTAVKTQEITPKLGTLEVGMGVRW